jgi:hypothetical protein
MAEVLFYAAVWVVLTLALWVILRIWRDKQ